MTECEEPNCRAQATTEWNGRKVCQDHYDKYRDRYEERLMELND